MSTLEEFQILKDTNLELALKVQQLKIELSNRDMEKLNLMKECNRLKLELANTRRDSMERTRLLKSTIHNFQNDFMAILKRTTTKTTRRTSFDNMAEGQRCRIMDYTRGTHRRFSQSDRVRRVAPLIFHGNPIQPVVTLSRIQPNINTSTTRNVPENGSQPIPQRDNNRSIQILQDVYIPVMRLRENNQEEQNSSFTNEELEEEEEETDMSEPDSTTVQRSTNMSNLYEEDISYAVHNSDPVADVGVPVNDVNAPTDDLSAPIADVIAYVDGLYAPVDHISSPVDELDAAADDNSAPADDISAPADETSAPNAAVRHDDDQDLQSYFAGAPQFSPTIRPRRRKRTLSQNSEASCSSSRVLRVVLSRLEDEDLPATMDVPSTSTLTLSPDRPSSPDSLQLTNVTCRVIRPQHSQSMSYTEIQLGSPDRSRSPDRPIIPDGRSSPSRPVSPRHNSGRPLRTRRISYKEIDDFSSDQSVSPPPSPGLPSQSTSGLPPRSPSVLPPRSPRGLPPQSTPGLPARLRRNRRVSYKEKPINKKMRK